MQEVTIMLVTLFKMRATE